MANRSLLDDCDIAESDYPTRLNGFIEEANTWLYQIDAYSDESYFAKKLDPSELESLMTAAQAQHDHAQRCWDYCEEAIRDLAAIHHNTATAATYAPTPAVGSHQYALLVSQSAIHQIMATCPYPAIPPALAAALEQFGYTPDLQTGDIARDYMTIDGEQHEYFCMPLIVRNRHAQSGSTQREDGCAVALAVTEALVTVWGYTWHVEVIPHEITIRRPGSHEDDVKWVAQNPDDITDLVEQFDANQLDLSTHTDPESILAEATLEFVKTQEGYA